MREVCVRTRVARSWLLPAEWSLRLHLLDESRYTCNNTVCPFPQEWQDVAVCRKSTVPDCYTWQSIPISVHRQSILINGRKAALVVKNVELWWRILNTCSDRQQKWSVLCCHRTKFVYCSPPLAVTSRTPGFSPLLFTWVYPGFIHSVQQNVRKTRKRTGLLPHPFPLTVYQSPYQTKLCVLPHR